jgi:hypothetical protein
MKEEVSNKGENEGSKLEDVFNIKKTRLLERKRLVEEE